MPQILKCPSCAAPLEYDGRSPSIKCDYCNNITLMPASNRQKSVPSGPGYSQQSAQYPVAFPQSLHMDKLIEINEMLERGQKINAIKLFRETFNVGLKEAKEAVEALERGESVRLSGGQTISAFHSTFEQDEVGFNIPLASHVPGPVVLGGRPQQKQSSGLGCVSGFFIQFGCLLFLFFWIPFLIVIVGTLIFPDMVLFAAPFACDEGYIEAYSERVGYYSTANFEGNNIVLLHCVYGDGVDEIAHPMRVGGIIFAAPMAVMALFAFGISFVGSVRTRFT